MLLAADPDSHHVDLARRPGPSARASVDDVDYHFVDDAEFDRLIDAGEFVEWAPVFDYRYGTPKAPVKAALKAGRDILFDIDWQGTQQLHAAMGEDLVRIFILPPSMAELERRLRARGTDSEEVIAGRMQRAAGEISHWAEYDYVLINDDMDACLAEVEAIVAAERLKRVAPGRAGRLRPRTGRPGSLAAQQFEEARRGAGSRARRAVERRHAPRRRRPIARSASARRG